MPQTLTPEWTLEIGDNKGEQWSQLVHSLGNLTLTKYNAELSNKPYQEKRKELLDSHYVLNSYFADVQRWSPNAIRERGRALALLAIEIWGDVGRPSISTETEKPSSLPPVKIRFRDNYQSVVTWKDAFLKLLKMFDDSCPGLLLRIATEQSLHGVIALKGDRFRRSKVQIGDVYINTHASAAQLQDWCRKVGKIGGIDASEFKFIIPDDALNPVN